LIESLGGNAVRQFRDLAIGVFEPSVHLGQHYPEAVALITALGVDATNTLAISAMVLPCSHKATRAYENGRRLAGLFILKSTDPTRTSASRLWPSGVATIFGRS
jgi:hypothetical protein